MISFDFSACRVAMLAEIGDVLNQAKDQELACFAGEILAARRVFLAGAGRSGLAMRMLACRLSQAGLVAHFVGDATTPACGAGDLLLAGSASGSTRTLLVAVEQAKKAKARVLAITGSAKSLLAKKADKTTVLRGNARIKSKQPMGSLFEQSLVMAGDMIANAVICGLGLEETDLRARHANLE